jgi:hypothetical protein
MGAVLAMNMIWKPALGVAVSLAVTACGPLNEGNIGTGALQAIQSQFFGETAEPVPTVPVLTRAQVDANPGGYMVLNAYNGTMVTALAAGGSNGNRVTWLSANGPSVTTQNGIMVATRGFPRDLIASDVDSVMHALIAGGGSATRIHETLSDTDQTITQTFTCNVASQGRETIGILGRQIVTERFDERCRSDQLAFSNVYWINDLGSLVRSLQAVAPDSGYIQLDRP